MTHNWILFALCVILVLYASGIGETIDMALADLNKLIENMKRAQAITDRASADAAKHAVIMDNFEKRMDRNHETMGKIEEYEKAMAAMDTMGDNGGPPLEASFSSSAALNPPSFFDQNTGRQV